MKLCIIGAFGFDMLEKTTGGQPVKTRQLYYALVECYGKNNVSYIETYGWKKHPLKLFKSVLGQAKKCDAMIMLPAHNGLPVFARLLTYCKKRYHTKIFYSVIGGWLPRKTASARKLTKRLKAFNGIWVETNSMKVALNAQTFDNVTVVPNFRKMQILTEDELIYSTEPPFQLCTFSRVMKEKGIETAVEAVKQVNAQLGYTAYTLDIYGQVDANQTEWFENLKNSFPPYIRYCGCVAPEKSVETLKGYYALLFPTHFYTEGIPGTIIDAYAAGIPVIAAKWESCADVVDEGITGVGYDFDDTDMLVEILCCTVENSVNLRKLKPNCLIKAKQYTPENAIARMIKQFEA